MKIIVTYASSGAGHLRAAEAVYYYIKENYPQDEIKLVDVLEKSGILFRVSYLFGYSFLIRRAHWFWHLVFSITEFRALRIFTRPIARIFNVLNTLEFRRFLIRENPDCIVSSHFLPSEIAASLKKSKKIKSKLITIVTDYVIHPFWICSGTDTYIVGLAAAKEQLVRAAVEERRIKDLGIPIHPKFLRVYDKEALLRKFGLNKDRLTLLIITGSFGIGPIEDIVDSLCHSLQMIVVCAKNKRLYQQLKERNYPGVLIFGFVDNMQELMTVSDLVVTKPGGSSIAEILNMGLPAVFISAIPGQETGNIKILRQYGIGLHPKDIRQVKDVVLDLKQHPDKLEKMRQEIIRLKKHNTLKEIAGVIRQGSPGPAC